MAPTRIQFWNYNLSDRLLHQSIMFGILSCKVHFWKSNLGSSKMDSGWGNAKNGAERFGEEIIDQDFSALVDNVLHTLTLFQFLRKIILIKSSAVKFEKIPAVQKGASFEMHEISLMPVYLCYFFESNSYLWWWVSSEFSDD